MHRAAEVIRAPILLWIGLVGYMASFAVNWQILTFLTIPYFFFCLNIVYLPQSLWSNLNME